MNIVTTCLNQRNLDFDNPEEHRASLTEGIRLEPRYAYPFRERRQKDMGPENPDYHWDWSFGDE